MPNYEKAEAYALLKTKMKIALKNNFWFEVCMIEYAIIEDRTASILMHTGIVKDASYKKLSGKLNSIEYQIGKKHPVISKKVSLDTVNEIRAWKERRNELTHRLLSAKYDDEICKDIALCGKTLTEKISNDAQKVKRASEKEKKYEYDF